MEQKPMHITPIFVVVQHAQFGYTVKLGPYKSSYSMTLITSALHKLGIKYVLEDAPCSAKK